MNLFRAPAAARAAKTLDRALFARTLNAAAASVRENKLLSKYRKELEKTNEILFLDKFNPILPDPDPTLASQGKKCLVLAPQIKPSFDVLRAILPEELQDEIPTGFNTVGHVAHLNIRSQYLPYKKLIAEVLLDKNPHLRTVINKIDNVGSENEFRTFAYEVLGGPDDLNVEVSEAGCVFKFDYSKVYWNSKLDTEHKRVTSLFKPGEVVADVMAGIGPFAVPAGKKGVFVWANDKNPESYRYLEDAIRKNKVSEYVKPFNCDGHEFVHRAADLVLEASKRGDYAVIKPPKQPRNSTAPAPAPIRVPVPPTISHFVMNLPASAIEFLHSYRGLYHGREELFAPHTETKLPMIHAHCFSVKADDETPLIDICQRIEREIEVLLKPGEAEKDGEVLIYDVRDVAPAKRMFCATFRLPHDVAFAPRA
ncbi:tRNA (guanine(37)-N1)-methyltransferase [Neonectria ditissima]|uniref:tRNA (guanine(37)-N1)-methyltransferase n=1 Tax=Neonectria ditissima TaxID=78410 RepID=A0A0P7BIB1_9HYPO|nr:tRNA (guanine(37)-N1)-methyltransferase [Neonectria ditissima]